jgi:hypothetical protein
MWSRKYSECVQCKTIKVPHKAKGLCCSCYDRKVNNKYKTTTLLKTRNHHVFILTKEFLEKEYIENKKSICDLSKETGIDRRQISRYLKKHGINTRSCAESYSLAVKNGKSIGNLYQRNCDKDQRSNGAL